MEPQPQQSSSLVRYCRQLCFHTPCLNQPPALYRLSGTGLACQRPVFPGPGPAAGPVAVCVSSRGEAHLLIVTLLHACHGLSCSFNTCKVPNANLAGSCPSTASAAASATAEAEADDDAKSTAAATASAAASSSAEASSSSAAKADAKTVVVAEPAEKKESETKESERKVVEVVEEKKDECEEDCAKIEKECDDDKEECEKKHHLWHKGYLAHRPILSAIVGHKSGHFGRK